MGCAIRELGLCCYFFGYWKMTRIFFFFVLLSAPSSAGAFSGDAHRKITSFKRKSPSSTRENSALTLSQAQKGKGLWLCSHLILLGSRACILQWKGHIHGQGLTCSSAERPLTRKSYKPQIPAVCQAGRSQPQPWAPHREFREWAAFPALPTRLNAPAFYFIHIPSLRGGYWIWERV